MGRPKKDDKEEEKVQEKVVELSDIDGLGPVTIDKLRSVGIDSVLSLAVSNPSDICDATGMTEANSRKIIGVARKNLDMNFDTLENYERETKKGAFKISTGSKELDKILDGGIESGSLFGVYGEYASGKSQLAHQLTVNTIKQFPEGIVFYIDTENSFKPERIIQMSKAVDLDYEIVKKQLRITKAFSFDHQLFFVAKIKEAIQDGENIKLIVVDSLTNHIRAEMTGRGQLADRQQRLNRYLHELSKISDMYNIPVFITNQVMSDPGNPYGNPIKPVGGNVLSHALKYILYVRKGKDNTRVAKLIDAPHLPIAEATYVVTEDGIGDVE